MGCSLLRGVRESLRDEDPMRARILIAGVEATVDVELHWRVSNANQGPKDCRTSRLGALKLNTNGLSLPILLHGSRDLSESTI